MPLALIDALTLVW